jgi:hypothetical protein
MVTRAANQSTGTFFSHPAAGECAEGASPHAAHGEARGCSWRRRPQVWMLPLHRIVRRLLVDVPGATEEELERSHQVLQRAHRHLAAMFTVPDVCAAGPAQT